MRRVFKLWPPKNVSRDDQPSCTLQAAEQALRASLLSATDKAARARGHFEALDKRKLREVLYTEQRYICVYCERQIEEGTGANDLRIDHWRPLKRSPELALHWKNLHLSCAYDETCDKLKGANRLARSDDDDELPWPSDAAYEDWIGFTSMGEAYVRADAPLDEASRKALEHALDCPRRPKATLYLNHPALVAARKAAIDSERTRIGRDFAGSTASRDQRVKRAAKMLSEASYPSFVSIRVAWLRRALGKSKPIESEES